MNKREQACYETDASRLKGIIERVFFPESIEQVQKIVKSSGFDIVPRGSGTNLVGGCIGTNSIIIDMSKMNRVTNFQSIRKTVRTEAGITLKELNEKLNSLGFEFPIDVSNKGISSIGGMIAMNSSGDRNLRYGSIRDWIEEIEFVNGKGELSRTSKADLTDVCGMEGITGIIVGATLKLAPIIKRSASVFQSDNIDEVLSLARKLRAEKEVVIIELFSPNVSKILGLSEKYNLIIEFNSNRGKIKEKDYEDISRIRENVFYKLYSEGYYNVEDPKFFFDKIKEFILFLEEEKVPYVGHLGSGIIHPFFKDKEKEKIEKVIDYIKKMKAIPGKFGIGLKRKFFIESFQAKLIQRVKIRHDPYLKFNKGKVIDIDDNIIPVKLRALRGRKVIEEEKEELTGEKISALKILSEINECLPENDKEIEKSPEEKMEEFIKEIEEKDKIDFASTEKENLKEGAAINLEKKHEEVRNEVSFQEVSDKLKDYEETYKSELSNEKMQKVEEIVRNIPREIVKKEMELEPMQEKGKVKISDNLERKSSLSPEDKDLINKILGNRYKKDDKKNYENK